MTQIIETHSIGQNKQRRDVDDFFLHLGAKCVEDDTGEQPGRLDSGARMFTGSSGFPLPARPTPEQPVGFSPKDC